MQNIPLHGRFEDLLIAATRYLTASQLEELSHHTGKLDMAVADYRDAIEAYESVRQDPISVATETAHQTVKVVQRTLAEVHRLIAVAAKPLESMLAEVSLDKTLVEAAEKAWKQAIKKVGLARGDFKPGISLKAAADQGVYIQAINGSPVVRQAFVDWQREARDNRTPSELQDRASRIAKEATDEYWSYCDSQTQGENHVLST